MTRPLLIPHRFSPWFTAVLGVLALVSRHIEITANGAPLDITFLHTDKPVSAGYVRMPIDISGNRTVPWR